MKEWLVIIAGVAFCLGMISYGHRHSDTSNTASNIVAELTWDGCQYLRFAGNEQTLIHKANCTNAVHWKELERR